MIPSVEATVVFLQTLAVPLILLLFYLDGMVIGKMTPPGALYVVYVVLVAPTPGVLLVVGALSVVAATLGQFTLYRGFNKESPEFIGIRRTVPYVDRIPFMVHDRVGERKMHLINRLLDRYGGIAITVTNVIPGVRSLMSAPAGLSQYPRGRFLFFSTLGNVLYAILLTAIAWEIVDLTAYIP